MSKQQQARMLVDPATGETKPYPSHAAQWREYHGSTAWLWNPWTAERRHASDVGSDPFGYLIAPPGEPVFAEPPSTEAKEGEWRPIDGNTPTGWELRCEKCGRQQGMACGWPSNCPTGQGSREYVKVADQ